MIIVPNGLSRALSKGKYHYARSSKSLLQAQRPRHQSTLPIVDSPSNEITTEVKAGIGRSTRIRITFANRPEINGPIILNLGRGIKTQTHSAYTRELSLSANATIVQPEYHVSESNPYPAPIHMTIAVYDWIWRNLINGRGHLDGEKPIKFGVCGELVAGSLAAMLALTECKAQNSRVSAAAIGNPILDWTDLFPEEGELSVDDLQKNNHDKLIKFSSDSTSDAEALSIQTLMSRRKDCFRKPEDFFDPFASPTLFFRTPCFDLPYQPPHPLLLHLGLDNEFIDKPGEPSILKRKRLYHRTYPPLGSALQLPAMKFTVGDDFVLRDQAPELASLMRRSGGRRRGMVADIETEDEGEEEGIINRFTTEEKKGVGLWGAKDVIEVGRWFGEMLRMK